MWSTLRYFTQELQSPFFTLNDTVVVHKLIIIGLASFYSYFEMSLTQILARACVCVCASVF